MQHNRGDYEVYVGPSPPPQSWENMGLFKDDKSETTSLRTLPEADSQHPALWDSFLRQNFPNAWQRIHGRPVFQPGEPQGVFGPTNAVDSEIWKRWLQQWGSEHARVNDRRTRRSEQLLEYQGNKVHRTIMVNLRDKHGKSHLRPSIIYMSYIYDHRSGHLWVGHSIYRFCEGSHPTKSKIDEMSRPTDPHFSTTDGRLAKRPYRFIIHPINVRNQQNERPRKTDFEAFHHWTLARSDVMSWSYDIPRKAMASILASRKGYRKNERIGRGSLVYYPLQV